MPNRDIHEQIWGFCMRSLQKGSPGAREEEEVVRVSLPKQA